ncbi:MAG: cyclic nucleotide-binding domain-containing protein, partial [Pseudonocardia sp.]|nr:cyclic nucleotide-binding domain-containing protein [Pseudonocardia sp.]
MNDLRRPWPPKSFLGRLSEQTRDDLLALCRQVRYDGGSTLLAQGDRNRHAILIFDGAVKVQLIDSRGYESLLAVRQRGEMLGELAALSGEPRTASVIAIRVVRAGVVSGPVLQDFLACHP